MYLSPYFLPVLTILYILKIKRDFLGGHIIAMCMTGILEHLMRKQLKISVILGHLLPLIFINEGKIYYRSLILVYFVIYILQPWKYALKKFYLGIVYTIIYYVQ